MDWQAPAAFFCISAAALYMLFRLKQFVCGTGIGGCHDCPKSAASGSHDGTHVISEDQITVTFHDDDPN